VCPAAPGPAGSGRQGGSKSLTALHFFVLAALAKVLSTACTYPLQIAQSKLRAMPKAESEAR